MVYQNRAVIICEDDHPGEFGWWVFYGGELRFVNDLEDMAALVECCEEAA